MTQQTMSEEVRLLEGCEVRAVETGSTRKFTGRAVPYGSPALIAGRFEEIISPGTFTKSLSESAAKLPLLLAHEMRDLPLGHLEEWDDRDDGLYGTWRMSDGEHATNAWTSVREGSLSGLSIHFRPITDDWVYREAPEFSTVTRREAALREISLCAVSTWPEARVLQTRTAKGGPVEFPRLRRMQEWRATV